MEKKKMTKKEMFAILVKVLESDTTIKNQNELIDFCNKEIEILNKKYSQKTPTKNQKENENLKQEIFESLLTLNKEVTVTELINQTNLKEKDLSTQKVSALLKKLVDDDKSVIKTKEKKKSYYRIA